MAFGDGYRRVESKPLATEGEHLVSLGIPSFKEKGIYKWLEFPIVYENGAELEPSSFALFDVVDKQDKKKMDEFNRRATKIFDCFDLQNSFDQKLFPTWKGKTGTVIIAKTKDGFLNVVNFIKSKAVENRQQKQKELSESDSPIY